MGGSIEIDLSAGTSTRVHELAHEILLHRGSELPASVKELEAEADSLCRVSALWPAIHLQSELHCPAWCNFGDDHGAFGAYPHHSHGDCRVCGAR